MVTAIRTHLVGSDFLKKHGVELQDFVYRAATHGFGGDGSGETVENPDGTILITWHDGAWGYEDRYTNGEPFAGMTTVTHNGLSCWSMVYRGQLLATATSSYANKSQLYACLTPALRAMPKEHPFRGPSSLIGPNGLRYTNVWHGDIGEYWGDEEIRDPRCGYELLFKTHYLGGVVNLA